MRISTQMVHHGALRAIRSRLTSLVHSQQEVATGRRVRQVSDAPSDAAQIMRLDGHVRDIEQFRRTGVTTTTRLAAEDVVLTSARDLITRARALASNAATKSTDDPVRIAALAEIQQIQSQLVSLANTKVGNDYLFSGSVVQAPFFDDGTYVGDKVVRQAQIDSGVLVDVNRPGDEVLSTALQGVHQLTIELATGSSDSIRATVATLEAADQEVLVRQAEVGATLRQIDETGTILGRRAAAFLEQRDGMLLADPAESALRVVSAQEAMERSYAAIGRLLQTSLVDFLR
jgi:flagellar hook-associated protein 3 FlgL